MKKIEAYQTSDGMKFLKKPEAQSHEDRLRYESKVQQIETYLYMILGIENQDPLEDGESPEDQLSDMFMNKGISGVLEDAIDLGDIVRLVIDVATVLDGALLKAAQYAKEITALNKKGT